MTHHALRSRAAASTLLALLSLATAAGVLAADCEQAPFAAARQQLIADRHGEEPTFASCEILAGNAAEAAALFAWEQPTADEGVKTFDVQLLLLNAASGAIVAQLARSKVWESDAYKIDSAGISDVAWPLRAGATIVGVSESWSGSSNVSFYNLGKLSLYERRGRTLVPLLAGFITDLYQGDGCDLQTTRELRPESVRGKGYASLRVVEKISSVARDGASCEARDEESDQVVLRVQGGRYSVPRAVPRAVPTAAPNRTPAYTEP